MSEAGDTTHKYWAIRELLAHYKRLPPAPVPPNSTKAAYGRVELVRQLTLPDFLRAASPPPASVDSALPRSMESLGVWRGFLLYQWPTPSSDTEAESEKEAEAEPESAPPLPLRGALWITGMRDRAYVFDQNWLLLGARSSFVSLSIVYLSSSRAL